MKELVTEKRIGVIAGGVSAEREVSLKSGNAVFGALKGRGYDVVFIDATEGICETLGREGIELAFLALHGGWGEDGSLQGMLEVMGIPYTGSGVLASALAMNKEVSKKIFQQHGLNVPPYIVVGAGDRSSKSEDISIVPPFPAPWVVKPSREGSSVGVSVISTEQKLNEAIKEALAYGGRVIVESFVEGREVQVGILGESVLGGVEVRTVRRFYDYHSKYTPGLTEYILPPEIDEDTRKRVEDISLRAHKALGCRGATRVDLIVDGSDLPCLLEVNTIPGMTETSLLPKIAALAGYDFPSLIEAIMMDTMNRRGEQ
ncbi:D-alanine--D-alanine ligase [hydrothermal vent metagenome]|uniref:D-alanine--D-alanine ligase n=1 Tax=hydrothermal vent metagenome TaxID=652676 RepID=A0A3B1D1M0_9ZZZZ